MAPSALQEIPTLSGRPLAKRPGPRVGPRLAIALAITAPLLGVVTIVLLNQINHGVISPNWGTAILIADALYFLLVVVLIGTRTVALVAATRAHSAGSRLHVRWATAFTLMAVGPVFAVAVFAMVTIRFGLQEWFSENFTSIVESSQQLADAYIDEHSDMLGADTLEIARALTFRGGDGIQLALNRASLASDADRVFIIDNDGRLLLQGANSFLFHFVAPSESALESAARDGRAIVADPERDQVRVLLRLNEAGDRFLYTTRILSPETLRHVEPVRSSAQFYLALAENQPGILTGFGLLYAGFAALIMVAAVWLGFWTAERMSNPIARLAEAAQRIGRGDFAARVPEASATDEIGELSRTFNQMAEQVGDQQRDLLNAQETSEIRRQFTESVLAGVPSGVIGLDANDRIEVVNREAAKVLDAPTGDLIGTEILQVFPEVQEVLERARHQPGTVTSGSVKITSEMGVRELVIRISSERVGHAHHGFVVTIEDLTELAGAQRLAAWGEIARRIAHEIKNPLTPIQLAAERLRDRKTDSIAEAQEFLDRYTTVIIQQVEDISRLVDDFSKLARLPAPQLQVESLCAVLDDVLLLERAANDKIEYRTSLPDRLDVLCDRTLLSQAVVNVLKNAALSIADAEETASRTGATPVPGVIAVELRKHGELVQIDIHDNGIGFPREDRNALLEPYRSSRSEGSGLGLAIVSRALEAHAGSVVLLDPPSGQPGALVRLQFPATLDKRELPATNGGSDPA